MESDKRRMRKDFVVPKRHVKRVKTALEERNLLDKTRKITSDEQNVGLKDQYMVIGTTITVPAEEADIDDQDHEQPQKELIEGMGLGDLANDIIVRHSPFLEPDARVPSQKNPMLKALEGALESLDKELLTSLDLTIEALISSFPTAYTIYKPMVLLPPNTLTSPPWSKLTSSLAPPTPDLTPIWKALAASVGCTHLALNAGIPLRSASNPPPNPPSNPAERNTNEPPTSPPPAP
ncbi:hypothetical protein P154DRAFT_625468, partial [Amniculicola lignicola CBS 123094]